MLISALSENRFQAVTPNSVIQGSLVELAATVGSQPVIFALPAGQCVLREVSYAPHERKLLQKIMPYTVEDDLVDRVEDIHFAIDAGSKRESGNAVVAYIAKKHLQLWLQLLDEQGINVTACIPELALLPWQPGQWSLVFPGNGTCLIRTGAGAGQVCSIGNLSLLLTILCREKGVPGKIMVWAEPSADVANEKDLLAAVPGATVDYAATGYSGLLQEQSGKVSDLTTGLNLLSGEYEPALPWRHWWQKWQVAAALVLAIGVADTGLRWLEGSRLTSQIESVRDTTHQLARQVLGEGVIVEPRLQLERKLLSLQGNSQSGFIALLDRASPVIMDNADIAIQNVDYSETAGELLLTLLTRDFGSVETVRARLESLGLEAELTGSSSSPEGNRSRLRVGYPGG